MNAEASQTTPGATGKPKLLIVEDDPALGRSLQRGTRAYFDVLMTTSLDAAFEVIDNRVEIAAAVVDINLPDGTGFDVVESLRQRDRDLPVLILHRLQRSGDDQPRARAAVEFVCKPFFSENLAQFVQRTLSGSQYGDREKLAVVVNSVEQYKLSSAKPDPGVRQRGHPAQPPVRRDGHQREHREEPGAVVAREAREAGVG
jgi:DNA-binding response OmpR family regulator